MLNAQDTKPEKQDEVPKGTSLQKSVKEVCSWVGQIQFTREKRKVSLVLWPRLDAVWNKVIN